MGIWTQSKKRKHTVEDSSSEEEIQSYDGKKRARLRSTEGHYDSFETLNLVEEKASDPAQQNMMVVQMETHSQPEPLSITPQPQKLDESTPTVSPAPSKVNSAPEATTAALMMMARTTSYVPKELPMPSFNLGSTDSNQEETLSQERKPGSQKGKSPETPKLIEQLEELVEKITNNGVKTALDFTEGKSPPMEQLSAGQIFETPNMAIGNHPGGEFLQPESKKPFMVEDYPMFIPFLDLKKLASHPYLLRALVDMGG
ncbi:hypothetical protein Ahy_B05g077749 [Arachis hypogaea]|uniref:Uncharacterized protein n=1 Tax=Arachis hypogaea TaxID=3818 RepID=A0A444Z5H5_ARAHY|nr:hypothetical protein Ahy_B05g077749 [Arachis hypogaea]